MGGSPRLLELPAVFVTGALTEPEVASVFDLRAAAVGRLRLYVEIDRARADFGLKG